MSVAGEYRRRTKGDGVNALVGIAIAATVFGLVLVAMLVGAKREAPQAKAVVPADARLQAQRLEVIRTLQRNGVLDKIDDMGGSIPKAYVLVGWHALTVDQKTSFANLWLAYWYQLPREAELQAGVHVLTIRDAYTGKDLGSFDRLGLRLK